MFETRFELLVELLVAMEFWTQKTYTSYCGTE